MHDLLTKNLIWEANVYIQKSDTFCRKPSIISLPSELLLHAFILKGARIFEKCGSVHILIRIHNARPLYKSKARSRVTQILSCKKKFALNEIRHLGTCVLFMRTGSINLRLVCFYDKSSRALHSWCLHFLRKPTRFRIEWASEKWIRKAGFDEACWGHTLEGGPPAVWK